MVSLNSVTESNVRTTHRLPSGLVAVFVGGTNGIGEATLKQFAKYTQQPRAYIIGRSQEAGDRIVRQCKEINQHGEFTFIPSDVSLIRNVDQVCQTIINKEKAINIVFLSIGTLVFDKGDSQNAWVTLNVIDMLPHCRNGRGP